MAKTLAWGQSMSPKHGVSLTEHKARRDSGESVQSPRSEGLQTLSVLAPSSFLIFMPRCEVAHHLPGKSLIFSCTSGLLGRDAAGLILASWILLSSVTHVGALSHPPCKLSVHSSKLAPTVWPQLPHREKMASVGSGLSHRTIKAYLGLP